MIAISPIQFDQHAVDYRKAIIAGKLIASIMFFAGMTWPVMALADDIPAPAQLIGDHSSVTTNDGSIRDDELWDFICEQIIEAGHVKDVKLMAQECYGGGMLDDMERVFGEGGACEGVSWVGGSASAPDKVAYGSYDADVANFPAENLGSSWTNGLAGNSHLNVNSMAGVIRNGSATNNVLQDLQAAGQNDVYGSNGARAFETAQLASGNGGDQIMWNMEGAKHEAVVFGGLQNAERHHNNVENMTTALENTWPDGSYNIQTIDGGSKQDLKNAIEMAAGRLDANTQLVIYIDDHGESSFDFEEAIGGIANLLIEDPVSYCFDIPDGWYMGLFGNYFGVPSESPNPHLDLNINQCTDCSNWNYSLNGNPVGFPNGNPTGPVNAPFDFWTIRPGMNCLDITPQAAPFIQASGVKPQTHNGSLIVSGMELSTGPVSELGGEQLLLPGQSAAFFDPNRDGEGIFVELLDDGQVVVYMFTYGLSGGSQAWMAGLGRQVGEGIIVTEMLLPTGPSFGPGYDPADLVFTDFGGLAFHLPTCGTSLVPGSLFVSPDLDTNYEDLQDFDYIQLTRILDCEASQGLFNSPLSGSWFDPSHNGEGLILEVLTNGVVVVQWFTYDGDGNQMWMQGTGTIVGNTLTVTDLTTTSGTVWGPSFNPADIVRVPWGMLTMEFDGCGTATVNYMSTAGFGSGTLNMIRLTNLMGITCT